MRLLLITRACNEHAGGMERLSFELIQELQKLPNLEVRVIRRRRTSRLGAVLFVLASLPRALWHARWADVIHLGDPVLALHAWLIRKLLKKPVAVTIHGLDVTYRNSLYQLYLKLFGKFDLTLPISDHAQQALKMSVVSSQSSVVINPGVYDRHFYPSITRQHLVDLVKRVTNYELRITDPVLFTSGRLVKRKGHAWFIENVLPHLPKNTVYLIAGAAPNNTPGEFPAGNTPGVSRSDSPGVLWLGRVSDADLKILYNTVDAFIQPNIPVPGDAEGFGLVLLEAALCQRPVFAANIEGIPDAIHDQKNGTLLPPQNAQVWIAALSSFLKNPQPVPAARAYTQAHFSWSKQARKYIDALSILTQTPSAPIARSYQGESETP